MPCVTRRQYKPRIYIVCKNTACCSFVSRIRSWTVEQTATLRWT